MDNEGRDSIALMVRLDKRDEALLDMCLTCFKNNNAGSELLEFDSEEEEWYEWGTERFRVKFNKGE